MFRSQLRISDKASNQMPIHVSNFLFNLSFYRIDRSNKIQRQTKLWKHFWKLPARKEHAWIYLRANKTWQIHVLQLWKEQQLVRIRPECKADLLNGGQDEAQQTAGS